jgi:hypothetical protein
MINQEESGEDLHTDGSPPSPLLSVKYSITSEAFFKVTICDLKAWTIDPLSPATASSALSLVRWSQNCDNLDALEVAKCDLEARTDKIFANLIRLIQNQSQATVN